MIFRELYVFNRNTFIIGNHPVRGKNYEQINKINEVENTFRITLTFINIQIYI